MEEEEGNKKKKKKKKSKKTIQAPVVKQAKHTHRQHQQHQQAQQDAEEATTQKAKKANLTHQQHQQHQHHHQAQQGAEAATTQKAKKANHTHQQHQQHQQHHPAQQGAEAATTQKAGKKRRSSGDTASGVQLEAGRQEQHPFPVDPTDHAETPLEAYQDIAPLLQALARTFKKKASQLRIYDPYYCDGGVKRRLNSLGFPCVINDKVNFYQAIARSKSVRKQAEEGKKRKGGPEPDIAAGIPDYDVLLTNPPYSGEHVERLLTFCCNDSVALHGSMKPWLILVPNWVYAKDYYRRLALSTSSEPPVMLIPNRGRYSYVAPFQSCSKVATAPFPSMFIGGGMKHAQPDIEAYFRSLGKPQSPFHLARTIEALPYTARTETDPLRSTKRPNPKQRKRLKAAAAAAAAAMTTAASPAPNAQASLKGRRSDRSGRHGGVGSNDNSKDRAGAGARGGAHQPAAGKKKGEQKEAPWWKHSQ